MSQQENNNLLYEEIFEKIIKIIKNKEWKPGSKIEGENELASYFHVSRNVIREVLKLLRLNHILVTKSGEGTYVSRNALTAIRKMELFNMLDKDCSIDELIEFRSFIEVELVSLATKRAKEDDLEKLDEIINKSMKIEYLRAFYEDLDIEFHLFIAKMAHNTLIKNLLNIIIDKLHEKGFGVIRYITEDEIFNDLKEHEQICNYIKDRNHQKAQEAISFHLKKQNNIEIFCQHKSFNCIESNYMERRY